MRARLFVVFLVPLTCILLALGGAYAWSVNRSIQQEFSNQQLGDLSYFVTSARQALRASNPGIVEAEMTRYSELYGAQIAVVDRSGAVWAAGDAEPPAFDERVVAQIELALSGRRSESLQPVLPWSLGDSSVVEPVFDDGSVIGAVLISASTDAPRSQIITQWILLITISLAVVLVLMLVVQRLSSWVLQPMRRVDDAMASIVHGDMDARISDDTGPPEMQHMIRAFNQMADEIERVVSRQQEFVMNASHELRNPLGALTLRVESLATGLDETWEDDIEKTREEGRRMSRILDTLLFMARAGMKDSPFAPVEIVGLTAGRLAAWEHAASLKHVSFEVSGETELTSITDRTAVESALDAVLDNALKFAPKHSVVEVRNLRDEEGCLITVRDHGPGLEPDDIERATDRFWRSPRDQNVPGSGLGLAIAADLLSALGGRIDVAPAAGGGLEVSLHLPGGDLR